MPNEELPDLKNVLDRLFSKSKQRIDVAGHSLFERPAPAQQPAAPNGKDVAVQSVPPLERGLAKLRAIWSRLAQGMQSRCVIGVDLGATAVKVIRVDYSDGAPKITGAAFEEYPGGSTAEERSRHLQQRLQKLKADGLLGGRIVMGVVDSQVSVQELAMPKMPPADLESAVAYEAKERMGIEAPQHCIRYLAAEGKAADGQPQTDVLVFAVPRDEVVLPYHLLSEYAGPVAAAEPEILASVAALDRAGLIRPGEFVGVLDIGFQGSTLALVVDKRVRFVRSFQVGGDVLTKSIADYCKWDYPVAEVRKQNAQLPRTGVMETGPVQGESENQAKVLQAMAPTLERLANDVDHALRYVAYYTLGRGEVRVPGRFFLVGGGSLLKNYAAILGTRLGTAVAPADPFDGFPMDERSAEVLSKPEIRARMVSALGLALRPPGE